MERLRSSARRIRAREVWIAVILGPFGIVLIAVSGLARSGTAILLIGIGCIAAAIFLAVRSVTGGDALTRDLADVRVESVEGALLARADADYSEGEGTTYHYTLQVAGKRFDVDHSTFQASPTAGYVRLYYLPKSHKVVNLEHLADKPIPETMSLQDLLHEFAAAHFSWNDNTRRAEGLATLASFQHAFMGEAAMPPAPEARDPRPLSDAILGTWSSPMFGLGASFMPNGTVTITAPEGRKQTGHWSVDAEGVLHADVFSHGTAIAVWVKEDQLTIPVKGTPLAFKRLSN